MKALVLATLAAVLLIPAAHAQESENLLNGEQPKPATVMNQPATDAALAPAKDTAKAEVKKAVKKKAAKKGAKGKKVAAKKAAKKKAATTNADAKPAKMHAPKTAHKMPKRKQPQQVVQPYYYEYAPAAATPSAGILTSTVGGSPIYSTSGVPVVSGQ